MRYHPAYGSCNLMGISIKEYSPPKQSGLQTSWHNLADSLALWNKTDGKNRDYDTFLGYSLKNHFNLLIDPNYSTLFRIFDPKRDNR